MVDMLQRPFIDATKADIKRISKAIKSLKVMRGNGRVEKPAEAWTQRDYRLITKRFYRWMIKKHSWDPAGSIIGSKPLTWPPFSMRDRRKETVGVVNDVRIAISLYDALPSSIRALRIFMSLRSSFKFGVPPPQVEPGAEQDEAQCDP